MKRNLNILLVFIINCFFVNTYVCGVELSNEKIYVSSNDILIGNNGIFVKLNDQIVQVQMVSYDSQGIFIEPVRLWKCPGCERHFPAYEDECPFCQRKKPK